MRRVGKALRFICLAQLPRRTREAYDHVFAMFRRPNRHAPAADARGDDRGRAVPNLAQTVVETRMMRDPRDEPEGEYLPRVGMSREDQRVAVARRLVVIDRLVIDEDSRGRSRRLARQFRKALTAPPRVFAPHEGQGAVDDARLVDERANLRFAQRGLNVLLREVRRPDVRAAVVIPVDVVDSEPIFSFTQDRERLAHLFERRPFVDDIAP